MSTKIFNGFKLKDGLTITDAFRILKEVQAQARVVAEDGITAWLVERVTNIADKQALGTAHGDEATDAPLMAAYNDLSDRLAKVEREKRRDPAIDFTFELTLFPLPDGRILGMTFTERDELGTLLSARPEIEEYGYWDNTDKPRGVSGQEWNKRRDDWDIAIPDTDPIPGQNGLSFTVTGPAQSYGRITDEEFTKRAPSFEKRVNREAINLVMDARFHATKGEAGERQVWGILLAAKEWTMDTEEGKAAVSQEKIRISGILERDLSVEKLLKGPAKRLAGKTEIAGHDGQVDDKATTAAEAEPAQPAATGATSRAKGAKKQRGPKP